jgi:antitoxin component of RelBE/YafQ-DinJ toxin-antitoxin module
MSNTSVLQVRADAKLISQAQKKADNLGFSSVQELVRVMLKSIAIGALTLAPATNKEQFPPEHIKLGPKAKKRWKQIIRDADKELETGNYFATDSVEEAMSYLFENKRK